MEINSSFEKKIAAIKAAEFVENKMTVGLGTGSTVRFFIERLGELKKEGLDITAVATSVVSERLAVDVGLETKDINDVEFIDLAVDGVDEIDDGFNAVKGGGGALFREKKVALLSKKIIWIMDSSKKVKALKSFPLPVEIAKFGYVHTLAELNSFGRLNMRKNKNGGLFETDNGNYIVDISFENEYDPIETYFKIKSIVGVLEVGLFNNMCDKIIVGKGENAVIYENGGKLK